MLSKTTAPTDRRDEVVNELLPFLDIERRHLREIGAAIAGKPFGHHADAPDRILDPLLEQTHRHLAVDVEDARGTPGAPVQEIACRSDRHRPRQTEIRFPEAGSCNKQHA